MVDRRNEGRTVMPISDGMRSQEALKNKGPSKIREYT